MLQIRYLLNKITFLLLISATLPLKADLLDRTLNEAKRMHQEGGSTQNRIDVTIEETQRLSQEYQQALRSLEQVNINLEYQKKIHAQQNQQISQLNEQLGEVENTENAVIPLLLSMVDWLELQISKDLPFHLAERQARVQRLKDSLIDPSVTLTERYRQVMEAYQIESEFGVTMESYREEIYLDGKHTTVNLLRVGRIGMYYQTLDGQRAGQWQQADKNWKAVNKDTLAQIQQGMLIAQKQRPHGLLSLPVEVTQK